MRGKGRVPGGAVLEVDSTAFLLLLICSTARLAVVVASGYQCVVTSNGDDPANTLLL